MRFNVRVTFPGHVPEFLVEHAAEQLPRPGGALYTPDRTEISLVIEAENIGAAAVFAEEKLVDFSDEFFGGVAPAAILVETFAWISTAHLRAEPAAAGR